jgi:hypothetical protein
MEFSFSFRYARFFITNRDIKMANRSFENVAQFENLETTGTNQNFIEDEIKRKFNSDKACYRSVQNLLSSRVVSRTVKIRLYKTGV